MRNCGAIVTNAIVLSGMKISPMPAPGSVADDPPAASHVSDQWLICTAKRPRRTGRCRPASWVDLANRRPATAAIRMPIRAPPAPASVDLGHPGAVMGIRRHSASREHHHPDDDHESIAVTRLRSASIARLNKGARAVNICTTNIHRHATATPHSIRFRRFRTSRHVRRGRHMQRRPQRQHQKNRQVEPPVVLRVAGSSAHINASVSTPNGS